MSRRAGQAGYTLIEVMVAALLLAVFVLGLSSLWTLSRAQILDQVVKQKAVFALNAEMERLTALYQRTKFGDKILPSTSGFDPLTGVAATRFIYPDDIGGFMTPKDSADFVVPDLPTFQTGPEFLVLTESSLLGVARNWIWIDRERSLLGSLSWTAEDIATGTCLDWAEGGGGAWCQRITLVIDFPFRLQDGAVQRLPGFASLTLRTITGRRT